MEFTPLQHQHLQVHLLLNLLLLLSNFVSLLQATMSKFIPNNKRQNTTPAATTPSSTSPAEEKDLPTSSSQTETGEMRARRIATPPSVDGVRTVEVEKIKEALASQNFLRLTDTTLLGDVWVQPILVEFSNTLYATIRFLVMLAGPSIEVFTTATKMSLSDLLKMLYLNDCILADFQGLARMDYDTWFKEKSAACVRLEGTERGTNLSVVSQFIITQDKEFTFYPTFIKNCGMFFRKISHHRYVNGEGKTGDLVNASMIQCSAAPRGKFQYVLEGKCVPLPDNWSDIANQLIEEATSGVIPPTQPMDL